MLNDPNTKLDTFTTLILENFKYLDTADKRAGFSVAFAFMNPQLTQKIENAAKLFRASIKCIDLTKKNTLADTLAEIHTLINTAIEEVKEYRMNIRTGFIQSQFFAKEQHSLGSFEKNMIRAIDAVISKIEDINRLILSNALIAEAENKFKPSEDKYLKSSAIKEIDWAKQSKSFQDLKNKLIFRSFERSHSQTTKSLELN